MPAEGWSKTTWLYLISWRQEKTAIVFGNHQLFERIVQEGSGWGASDFFFKNKIKKKKKE